MVGVVGQFALWRGIVQERIGLRGMLLLCQLVCHQDIQCCQDATPLSEALEGPLGVAPFHVMFIALKCMYF